MFNAIEGERSDSDSDSTPGGGGVALRGPPSSPRLAQPGLQIARSSCLHGPFCCHRVIVARPRACTFQGRGVISIPLGGVLLLPEGVPSEVQGKVQ